MRVLTIAHNHPGLHAGGTEILAHQMSSELDTRDETESWFLAGVDRLHRQPHPGTQMQSMGPRSALIWTGSFDRFSLTQGDSSVYLELERYLRSVKPDIVHVHHFILIGIEFLLLVKKCCPDAKIIVTLHDYYPIWHEDGTLLEISEMRRHSTSNPIHANGCFPDIPLPAFKVRDVTIRHMFSLVDQFISPSRFLADRYVEWGLPRSKLKVIRNGIGDKPTRGKLGQRNDRTRNRFAAFGNVSPYKGTLVALEAARRLRAESDMGFTLDVFGTPAFQTEEFKKSFETALDAASEVVRHHGAYQSETVDELMQHVDWVIMPSVWWENAPLTIEEAFRNSRPVICSGIGGMAERVTDDVNGLHFRAGDPVDLAQTMQKCLTDDKLWPRLRAGIPEVRTIENCADDHLQFYEKLLRPSRGGSRSKRKPASRRGELVT